MGTPNRPAGSPTPTPDATVELALRHHEWWLAGNLGVPGMADCTTYKCLCGWSGDEPRRHQVAAVLDALTAAGFALVDRATLEQLRDCYGDEFTDGLTSLPTTTTARRGDPPLCRECFTYHRGECA